MTGLRGNHRATRRRRDGKITESSGQGRLLPCVLSYARWVLRAPWQCLYFLPEPHGQGELRGVFDQSSSA